MKIVGLDPGLSKTGYAVLNERCCLCYGLIKSDKKGTLSERILEITKKLKELLNETRPEICAIETVFFKPASAQSIILSAHLRGAIFYLLTQKKIPIFEITPAKVKLAVCGYGRASKRQVNYMVRKLFSLKEKISDDAADALAAAYTCWSMMRVKNRIR